jgi:hypothetical protein
VNVMSRYNYLAVLIGIVACILGLYWYRSNSQKFTESSTVAETTSMALDPPRLATGAVSPRPASPSPDLRIVNDASSLALDEQSLKQRLRDNIATNPRLAEDLVIEGRRRFPGDTPESDERDAMMVTAVYNQGKIDLAYREADYYLEHHPNGRYREKLISLSTHR